MKIKRWTTSILFALISFMVFSQQKVEVVIETKEMSLGNQTAFTVFIPESNVKLVESEWKKFINERSFFEFATKGTSQTIEKLFVEVSNLFSKDKKTFEKNALSVTKVNDELVVKNVIHEEVTNNHIDVYAKLAGIDTGVYLSSFFQYSDSVFINETNVSENVIETLKSYLKQFGTETYVKVVEEQEFNERRELRKLEGELKNLKSKNKSMHNSIGKLETDIDESNNEIRIIQKGLELIEKEIALQKDSLRGLKKRTEEYDLQKEVLKSVQKDYNKEYGKIKSEKNKIKRFENRIRKNKADILINNSDQKMQLERINNQKIILEQIQEKLANISK